jgi:hypothetical protein
MPKPDREFDHAKFLELVLYVAAKCERDQLFDATKINKILFYSDFAAFQRRGHAITWANYIAREHGPVAPDYGKVRSELEQRREIAVQQIGKQQRPLTLRPPDLSKFEAEEITIVDEVIDALHRDATTVSDRSGAFLGWEAAWERTKATGQATIIPYETVFVSNEPLDEFEEAEGLALARKYGWPI